MARERNELGQFTASADEAAQKLKGFSEQVEESTRASSDHAKATKEATREAEARSERIGAAATLGAQSFTNINATGDLDAGLANLSQAAIRGLRNSGLSGSLAAEGLGLNRAENVLGAASGRVADVTGDLARYGIEIDPGFRSDFLRTAIDQEERVERERRNVTTATYTAANLEAAGANPAAAALLTAPQQTADTLKQILDLLRTFGGGGAS